MSEEEAPPPPPSPPPPPQDLTALPDSSQPPQPGGNGLAADISSQQAYVDWQTYPYDQAGGAHYGYGEAEYPEDYSQHAYTAYEPANAPLPPAKRLKTGAASSQKSHSTLPNPIPPMRASSLGICSLMPGRSSNFCKGNT